MIAVDVCDQLLILYCHISFFSAGEFIYWADYAIEPNPTEFLNAVPIQMARPYHENFGKAVTATSYALKLYLDRNLFEESTPIMKWLQTQRTGTMKFSSTLVCINLHYRL